MDRELFKQWYKDNAKTGYHPANLDEWLDTIDNNHKEIRSLLGGVTAVVKLPKLKQEHQNKINKLINEILSIIGNEYLYAYNLSALHLQATTLPKPKGISVGKHINGWLTRTNASQISRDNVNKLLSDLGQMRKTLYSDVDSTSIIVSTDPRAYVKIGQFGCEGGSCFTQGSFNCDKKYAFAEYPNSFVILNPRTKTDVTKIAENIVNYHYDGRALGIFDTVNKALHVTNNYGNMDMRTILASLGKVLLGGDNSVVHNRFNWVGGINYASAKDSYFADKEPKEVINISFTTKHSKAYKPNGDGYANWD